MHAELSLPVRHLTGLWLASPQCQRKLYVDRRELDWVETGGAAGSFRNQHPPYLQDAYRVDEIDRVIELIAPHGETRCPDRCAALAEAPGPL